MFIQDVEKLPRNVIGVDTFRVSLYISPGDKRFHNTPGKRRIFNLEYETRISFPSADEGADVSGGFLTTEIKSAPLIPLISR